MEPAKGDEEANLEPPAEEPPLTDSQFQSSWAKELITLTGRAMKLAGRERASNGARFGQTVIFSIILGLIWLSNGRDKTMAAQSSLLGVLFFMVINQGFGGLFSVIFQFPLERSVVTRERASNMYRASSYYLSEMLVRIPKSLFFNLIL